MRKSRFSDRQIVVVLKQAEAGVPIQDLVRKYGISEQTFYRWRKKYGGLQASELQQLKQLKEENRRLKGIVARLRSPSRVFTPKIIAEHNGNGCHGRETLEVVSMPRMSTPWSNSTPMTGSSCPRRLPPRWVSRACVRPTNTSSP